MTRQASRRRGQSHPKVAGGAVGDIVPAPQAARAGKGAESSKAQTCDGDASSDDGQPPCPRVERGARR